MNFILIGAQGSGKGTQSEQLTRSLGVRHVASGDMFRQAFDEKTELGIKAKAYLDRGELVPDDITVTMVLKRIKEPDCAHGVLLDGFPRTIPQAQALDAGLQKIGQQIDLMIYLKVPREELLKRLSGRYICRANQHVYNINSHPPKVAGICDLDGSELYQRSDDTGEAVEKRLDIFFNETVHLLDYYNAQQKVIEVNGNQGIDQVRTSILNQVKAFMASKNEG
ncbi:MAG TPA: adenylate kinase [Ktedonobacter sp.]|nr:adenylate kinase [Ktedonobacter sp.]HAG99516.1 adenylate kinase [Ktedonobacter sp.]HAT43821.1 adenylate kinase [Ktedonobacter sp.]HBE24660.1 adenylate kinase [Ktedonobacter sp.]HBE28830.1 adenylate kinase [Ktedonobacter sp.]